MSKTGGLGETIQKDDFIQNIVNNYKKNIEDKLKNKINKFNVHYYKTQVVAGINYFIKVELDNNIFIHLKIYKTLDNNFSLISYLHPQNKESPILYF
jgi:hypothetical protein